MIHTHAVNEQEKPTHDRKWLPFLLIVAASALAHLWCLRSQFYLDDLWQIRDNDYIRETRLGESFMLSWFYLSLIAQVKIFGMSSVGIHAVNWLLHTAIALVIYFSARDYLRSSAYKQAALFGALLFAVHPLGSEIPNYARAQDLAWVTLFSLLAAWMFFRFQHQKNWRYLIFSLLCIMGATCSKGPGLFHALMMVGVVGVAMMSAQYATFLHRHRRRIWIIVGMITVIFAITFPINPWLKLTWDWSSPRFVGHAFTVARVFWEFTWRGFVPIHLSADHHIAETLVRPGQGEHAGNVIIRCCFFVAMLASIDTNFWDVFAIVCGLDAAALFVFCSRIHARISDLPGTSLVLSCPCDRACGHMALAHSREGLAACIDHHFIFVIPLRKTLLPMARSSRIDGRCVRAIPGPKARHLGHATS